jgi:seryl-tRNA synthetase (EC 6.1.1.11)
MLDPKLIRSQLNDVAEGLKKRGYQLDVAKIQALEEERKVAQVESENLQQQRNTKSKGIGKAKASGEDIAPLLKEVENLKSALTEAEKKLSNVQLQMDDIISGIPNLLSDDVPVGKNEDDNVEVSKWGEPRTFDFDVKDHVDVGDVLGGLDFETAGKITGARFAIMTGAVARMHRALIQLMLNTHTGAHGYNEIYVPYIVNKDSLFGLVSCLSLRRISLSCAMIVIFI